MLWSSQPRAVCANACRWVQAPARNQIGPVCGAGVSSTGPVEHQLRCERLAGHDQRCSGYFPSAEEGRDRAPVRTERQGIAGTRREYVRGVVSGTPPFAFGIVRVQAGRGIPLAVVPVIEATLLVHDLGERVGGGKCHTRSGLPNHLHLQSVVVGVAVVRLRSDTVPVRILASDRERVTRGGRVWAEAVGGRRISGGIPLLPLHDFVVGIIELDITSEMPTLRTDVGNFQQITLTQLLLYRQSKVVFGTGGHFRPDRFHLNGGEV